MRVFEKLYYPRPCFLAILRIDENQPEHNQRSDGPGMTSVIDTLSLPLFLPADRLERLTKARAAGADAVILDLEDAVAADRKDAARDALAAALADGDDAVPVLVRVNVAGTPWHAADLAACAALPLAGIVLPKAESEDAVASVAYATGLPVIALIETAAGLRAAHGIAAASARIAFGSIDFAADIGCAHTREALLLARSTLVLAARGGGQPAPIDGVTTAIHDGELIADDCRHAGALGFGGKLLIHPAQIAPARAGFAPTPEEIAWARRIIEAAGDKAAVAVDGAMVDAPVILRAGQILKRVRQTETP